MKGKAADKTRLRHILEAIREIEKYLAVAGSEDDFYNNSALKFATVKQLEIIGEAAGKLSNEI
ncbi:MAG: HepT-like ribonuclease domain-containing protein [Chitinophagales bacterium]|nr:HepT-like ribonuclease domain-containing protein [Chitinophagales bacterium]